MNRISCMYVRMEGPNTSSLDSKPPTYLLYYVLLKLTKEIPQDHGKCVRFFSIFYFLSEPRPSACASPIHHPGPPRLRSLGFAAKKPPSRFCYPCPYLLYIHFNMHFFTDSLAFAKRSRSSKPGFFFFLLRL